ncbi:LOW QUALITY PROTEIN: probable xyloglucan galactosyltransferase GT19 [Phalaenopsis equestris]|uniref:LOW QUALITY PROTEIN: probable xyloglucan galactosyltransferase GT19 n=1 Tax=Phalaenopsis equestris TaxID=78828 RepID=UPI0009E30BDB|nr:LOW QUALITY PROTEIN: probable xyloglucan galactosyltransferase GT19 [Phalaenopsis equestris]
MKVRFSSSSIAVFSFLICSFLVALTASPALARSIPKKNGLGSKGNENEKKADEECEGRWIHIRELPAQFNTELLSSCKSFPIFTDDFCPFLANHGLGPRTHNRSLSWYRTDSHYLEPFFHRRLNEYPCLTADHARANAIFVPYYTSLDALPYLYSPHLYNDSAQHGLNLHRFLVDDDNPQIWARRSGHDHFLVIARPAWDFSQDPASYPPSWGTSFLHLPAFLNLTVLTVESRPDPWQEHAIPHPTSFHPATLDRLESWIDRASRSPPPPPLPFPRGGGRGGGARIRAECENRTDVCQIVDCSDGACSHDPIRYMVPMLRSRFCLQPPGDTPHTRRSTFDAIIAGCIPVFFEEISARLQYRWHLPPDDYEKFSVFIPKEEVVFGGVHVADVLEGVSDKDVRRMRRKVLELAPRVMYRRHGSSAGLRSRKDAFDVAIDGVLRRIKLRSGSGEPLLFDDDKL